MKMGFITSLFDGWTYDEMIDEVSRMGIQTIEVASWPKGKAERKYGGVTHIEAERVLEDDAYAQHILDYAAEKGVEICAIAYYPNNLDPDPERRAFFNDHLVACIHSAKKLGVPKVTTFIGRVTSKTFEENLEIAREVWTPILKVAEDEGILVCIENCPMLFDATNWPGGENIMTSPANWERVFEVLPSENLGLALDPSHFVWQMIDCGSAIREFADKIFHVHLKDISSSPRSSRGAAPWHTRSTSWTPRSRGTATSTGPTSSRSSRWSATTATAASRSRTASSRTAASTSSRASSSPSATWTSSSSSAPPVLPRTGSVSGFHPSSRGADGDPHSKA